MKNWRTTLLGLIGGLPFAIEAIVDAYNSGYFTDRSGWQLVGSIAFTVLMAIIKDPKKNNPDLGIEKKQGYAEIDGDGKVTPDKPPG